ncbi:hypothetical protein RhiirA5_376561 [Rhizophagus irregularis]|uniref:Uncharacterized protein n=1 Tax=Rhizophagus irregularis TaxID=588596 RepID=A0A2I1E8C9_9GLOM|nr:hypothetical protein RhiirA5_376561 [Rhizophagus irregularis]PKY18378.1 hypothetical protein RhiirB3_383266 [Rhizophagus irregularis]
MIKKYKSVLENDETSEAEERTLAIEERKLVIREQMAKVCFKIANIENEQEARKERTLAIEERKLVIREQTAKVRKEQEARMMIFIAVKIHYFQPCYWSSDYQIFKTFSLFLI